MKIKNEKPLVVVGIIIVIFTILASTTIGFAKITPLETLKIFINSFLHIFSSDKFPINSDINILIIRLPRILGAALAGVGLTLSGIIFQSILRNPLAEPYILGVSSGAALGAALSIILNISLSFIPKLYITPFFALSGAILSTLGVIFVSGNSSNSSNKIILYGVSFNFFLSSILTLLISLNLERSQDYLYWSMGRFSTMDYQKVLILLIITTLCTIVTLYYRKELNLFTMGLPVAKSLGLNIKKYRVLLLTLASVLTGVIVSFSGIIGFVGLVIPHIVRIFVGSENKRVISLSLPLGAIFMVLCDSIARSVLNNGIPVGVVTSLIGAPIFVFLLKKRSKI